MANREQRRAAKRAVPAVMRKTKEQRIAALLKNGITPEDLQKSFDEGVQQGITMSYKTSVAAACLALIDLYDFDGDKCHDVVVKMQEHTISTLTSLDAIQEVYKRVGLTLDFGDPLSWIQEAVDEDAEEQ